LFIAGSISIKDFFAKYNQIIFSAGVGRSGTFIALDALLEVVKSQDTIDILGFTHRMR
jgi:protein tyrosine phosphatase